MPEGFKCHVFTEVHDYEKTYPLEESLSQDQFNRLDFFTTSFNANVQRPVPDFVPISESELVWVSPGLITDVKYDFSN